MELRTFRFLITPRCFKPDHCIPFQASNLTERRKAFNCMTAKKSDLWLTRWVDICLSIIIPFSLAPAFPEESKGIPGSHYFVPFAFKGQHWIHSFVHDAASGQALMDSSWLADQPPATGFSPSSKQNITSDFINRQFTRAKNYYLVHGSGAVSNFKGGFLVGWRRRRELSRTSSGN